MKSHLSAKSHLPTRSRLTTGSHLSMGSPRSRPTIPCFQEVPPVPEDTASRYRETRSPPKGKPTLQPVAQSTRRYPGTYNPYELPLLYRSHRSEHPIQTAQLPKWPFRDDAVSEFPPKQRVENISPPPTQRKPTTNQDFATRTQISRTRQQSTRNGRTTTMAAG